MLVFWHCLNLNGPQFDCEINTSLRLIVGAGCHSHYFQSYCLSGMQREKHERLVHLLNQHLLLPLCSLRANTPTKSQARSTSAPFPTLFSLIHAATEENPLTLRNVTSSPWASFSSSGNWETWTTFLRPFQHGCLDQLLASDPGVLGWELPHYRCMSIACKTHNS